VETIGIITTVVIILAVFISILAGIVGYFQKPEIPKIAGTDIPELGQGLDITRRYDMVYSGTDGSQFIERLENVRIIGYVGQTGGATLGQMYLQSRWLVVEFADGRRAYLMPSSIISLKETIPSGQ
jgi:hypothetical protein